MTSIRRVSDLELREAFNVSRYFERAQEGKILVTLVRENTPDPRYCQPDGCKSQTLRYDEVRDGKLVKLAIVHQFVLADGTINNKARRPDPKWVLVGNEVWILDRPS